MQHRPSITAPDTLEPVPVQDVTVVSSEPLGLFGSTFDAYLA